VSKEKVITPEIVDKIEDFLEERKTKRDRRSQEEKDKAALEKERRTGKDRRDG
jgi:hypothetical protein